MTPKQQFLVFIIFVLPVILSTIIEIIKKNWLRGLSLRLFLKLVGRFIRFFDKEKRILKPMGLLNLIFGSFKTTKPG